jgi:hypothetical protein
MLLHLLVQLTLQRTHPKLDNLLNLVRPWQHHSLDMGRNGHTSGNVFEGLYLSAHDVNHVFRECYGRRRVGPTGPKVIVGGAALFGRGVGAVGCET